MGVTHCVTVSARLNLVCGVEFAICVPAPVYLNACPKVHVHVYEYV